MHCVTKTTPIHFIQCMCYIKSNQSNRVYVYQVCHAAGYQFLGMDTHACQHYGQKQFQETRYASSLKVLPRLKYCMAKALIVTTGAYKQYEVVQRGIKLARIASSNS